VVDWWGKRRKRSPWFGIFDDFEEKIGEMMNEIMNITSETTPKKTKPSKPFVFGFSISIGPNGKPAIQQFGNVQPRLYGPKIREEREPLVDVMEHKDAIIVVAELPGVEKSDIKINANRDKLTISVDKAERKYFKELDLPKTVDPKSARATYKNGVLEVKLKKSRLAISRGELIKIQ